jgi:transcriptional regulator with XRE-family HTH domain
VSAERPEDFVLRVARRIAEIRKAAGLTQDEFAEAMGTATRNVQRIEAGQNLTLYTLSRIATVLAVRPEDIVADDSSASQQRVRHPTATPAPVARRPDRRSRKRA